MIYPQLLLDVHDELLVDLFAGGGGASCGIEMGLGRMVDVAVNHDSAAVSLHQANHPQTQHFVSDVFEVDPRAVTGGRPVGLLWASPDCTYHSKARGAKPIRHKNRKRRALAWVVTRWAGQVRPRVIGLENVEEFADWGPLVGQPNALRPCRRRAGRTFRQWKRSLEKLGYEVQHRELRGCDYGAPTIRKRLFVIARCDGEPIVWPERTHGRGRGLKPFRTAAECIDWSIPMCSIFATPEQAKWWARQYGQKVPKRPLAENTMRRVARGVGRFVIDNPKPFIVGVGGRQGQSPERSLEMPFQTVTAKGDSALVAPILTEHANASQQRTMPANEPLRTQAAEVKGGHFALVAPYLVPRYGERPGQEPRALSIEQPAPVVVPTGNGASLAAAFLAKHYGGNETPGWPLDRPASTLTTQDHHHLVCAFLQSYYGTDQDQPASEPLATITTKDRHSLVTVEVRGEPYVIADIAMRMLQPRELYRAQGFPDSYIIDRGHDGRKLTKTEQVRMVGNSVCPPIAAALVRANVPEMIARDEARRSA